MNFEPRIILSPVAGSNADARTASVRVMNDIQPSREQLAELSSRFDLHMTRVRWSIAGFLTDDGVLSDGSAYRIVSNSGFHTVMLWPAGSARPPIEQLLRRIFCVPADTTHQYGWVLPTVTGQNGTTATTSTRANAGALASLALDKEATPPTFKFSKGGLKRYQPVLFPVGQDPAISPLSYSAQNWEHREWVSPDFKTVVFALDRIRINDADYGPIPSADALAACTYKYTPAVGDPVTQIFCAALDAAAPTVSFYRKDVDAAASWTLVASFNLTTIDPTATTNGVVGDNTARAWVKKVAFNASRTVCSLWLQHPQAEGQSHTGTHWVGILDINMSTGVATTTPASGEVTRYTRDAHPADNATFSWKWQTSGVRQIAFAYDGDTKVFTELHFSGAIESAYVYTRGTSGAAINDYTIDITTTDTREVYLVQGALSQRIGWVESASANTHHERRVVSSTPNVTEWERHMDTTVHYAVVDYFGGHRPDLLMVRTIASHKKINGVGDGTMFSGVFGMSSYEETTTNGTDVARKVHANAAVLLDNGSGTFATEVVTTASPGPIQNNTPADSGLDTNPSLQQAWGGASNTDVNDFGGYYLAPYGLPTGLPAALGLFNLGDLGANGHPSYVQQLTSTPDTSPMNCRTIGDEFIVLSVAKIGTGGVPQTDLFQSYSTDPAIIAAFNVDATTGILKGLRIK